MRCRLGALCKSCVRGIGGSSDGDRGGVKLFFCERQLVLVRLGTVTGCAAGAAVGVRGEGQGRPGIRALSARSCVKQDTRP
jgi:hypothetical protein